MRDLPFQKTVHAGKLHAELAAAVGATLIGVSTGAVPCIVHVADDATPADETTITGVVAAHDPTPTADALVVDLATAKTESGTNPLDNLTVAQALAWIDANVTDLASARTALKQVVKVLGIHERRLRMIERALGLPIGG
jgi:hypothetical protein